jgi:hypothetical protein
VFAVLKLGTCTWEVFSIADSMVTVQRYSWKKRCGNKVGEPYEKRKNGKGGGEVQQGNIETKHRNQTFRHGETPLISIAAVPEKNIELAWRATLTT